MPPLPPEVRELIQWCYADGCTPIETQRTVGNFWKNVPYSTVFYHETAYRERNGRYEKKRCQRPEVREHAREYAKNKLVESWARKRESSPRYAITSKGESVLDIWMCAADELGGASNLAVLQHLHGNVANEYELVDYLRERGVYKPNASRGFQVGMLRKRLRKMETDNLLRPE